MSGRLIIFEGPDGVGKTTLVEATTDFVQALGVPLISLSFPGKTPGTLGHLVYRIHHAQNELQIKEITSLALQALHVAAHLDIIESRIIPALNEGALILLDRTWWSTWVYGQAAKINEIVLSKLIEDEQLSWGGVTPSLVFLVQRSAAFRAEHSQEAFNILSDLYENLAAREELRYPVVRISNDDLQLSTNIIQESIKSILGSPFSE
jgi:dTMP kinase